MFKYSLTTLVSALFLSTAAQATVIDFEAVGAGAPPLFNFGAGPSVTVDGATFAGGTLLNQEFSSIDQTAVYATSPYGPTYSNPITISFADAVNDVSLHIVNNVEGILSLTSDAGDALSFNLANNVDQFVTLSGLRIKNVAITWAPEPSNVNPVYNFAIDNIGFSAAVPEPASWAMLIAGFGLTGMMMRRRSSAAFA